MPNIKSAKKRVKVNRVKHMINKNATSELRTVIKKAETAVANNAADSADAVKLAIKKIDQAAAKGILHQKQRSTEKVQPCLQAEKGGLKTLLVEVQEQLNFPQRPLGEKTAAFLFQKAPGRLTDRRLGCTSSLIFPWACR